MQSFKWDIFCKVIDNFGDIGVCWRLAKQLVNEHQQQVRLIVDDLQQFSCICPQINSKLNQQVIANVSVQIWQEYIDNLADVIIEAFGCNLSPQIIMQIQPHNLWLNLEYLTCEDFARDWHQMPSLQHNNARKFVYFPSLKDGAGGFIRESNLQQKLQHFKRDDFLQDYLQIKVQESEQIISLFCYPHADLSAWFQFLSQQNKVTHLLVLGECIVGLSSQHNLHIHYLPFIAQEDFDYLLACCDFNIVRGEDSFMRAQLVGKPFLWHIYPQKENAHLPKLDAFTLLYAPNSPPIRDLFCRFNQNNNWLQIWQEIDFQQLQKHAHNWAKYLATKEDLASLLLKFVRTKI